MFTRTRQRVIGVLFSRPQHAFSVSDIAHRVGHGSGALHRVLRTFLEAGIVTCDAVGNQQHYRANRDCPIFFELCAIAVKTVGIADPIRNALLPLRDRILAAFLRPRLSGDGLDVVILTEDLPAHQAEEALGPVRWYLARELWIRVMRPTEWRSRRRGLETTHVLLLGDESCLL